MKKTLSIFLCLIMLFCCLPQSFAADNNVDSVLNAAAEYLQKNVSEPQVGSIGGEWAVMGLARSGANVPDSYFENYYQTAKKYVEDCGGKLHDKKYTEYSRMIVALTSIGASPADVAGYNLLEPLGDYEKTIWQGINGAIWALLALDCGEYEMPVNGTAKVCATREMYIAYILEKQISDGGWAMSGNVADPDITAMALCALSDYRDDEKVREATEKALSKMSEIQNENGGFSSGGIENAESDAQMTVALTSLGIPLSDPRFVKNGRSVLDSMLTYYENGGFKHIHGGKVNQMATEQAFYALVAVKRFNDGKNRLYDMSDAISVSVSNKSEGLPGKNADIRKLSVVLPDKTFDDISAHESKKAIEELASRKIINGKTENDFEPDATMTRAEFATIIVRGLGLPTKAAASFSDVARKDWFYDYVSTAYAYEIVKGVSDTEFNPNGIITREEAAAMVARAAKLCGNNTDMETSSIRDILAGFDDYVRTSEWSRASLAFCFQNKILSDEVTEIKPRKAVTRAEIAQMLYNMLSASRLI